MKKLIIGIVLAVVLIAGGLGGFAYAQSNGHELMTGQKLVGTGHLGSTYYGEDQVTNVPLFVFTNPDCVGEITIERISIIRQDGTLIYEGPFLQWGWDGSGGVMRTPVTRPMQPHEVWSLPLWFFMRDGEDSWLTPEDAKNLPIAIYTLEIFWTGDKESCLPTGYTYMKRLWNLDEGNASHACNPMVNMEQALKPKK